MNKAISIGIVVVGLIGLGTRLEHRVEGKVEASNSVTNSCYYEIYNPQGRMTGVYAVGTNAPKVRLGWKYVRKDW